MANPLKMLKLKPTGFQFIQEVPIDAPPKKVWAALTHPNSWFGFDDRPRKHAFSATPGGTWTIESGGVSMLMGTITHVESEKLLRIAGPMGLSHLPVINAFIWELVPQKDGNATLLRCGQRCYGFITADIKKNFKGGWGKVLAQLKAASEK